MKISVLQHLFCLWVCVGCGFKSVNQTNVSACPKVDDIEVTTPSGYADWAPMLRQTASQQFASSSGPDESLTLRIKLWEVSQDMASFNGSGELTGTTMRFQISIDLVQGTRLVWMGKSRPALGLIQHEGDPKTLVMNREEIMRTQITNAVSDLALRYRQRCLLKPTSGDQS